MNTERKQILQMLAEGKINPDEAERLLAALEQGGSPAPAAVDPKPESGRKPKYLCITVRAEPGSDRDRENVDVKIPIVLLKAGVKLGSLVPEGAKDRFSAQLGEKGIDFDLNRLDAEKLEELIGALTETSIDVDSDKEKVRIFCC